MNKSKSIKEIVAAVVRAMTSLEGIDKSLTVGDGKSSYKGVADKDVKEHIGEAMKKNGLAIFPIGITPRVNIHRFVENGNYGDRQKVNVFTEVDTEYLLAHTSGEWIVITGHGHGIDSQDKSAGKATTYALKYALLYTFMVPTGKIDDAENTAPEKESKESKSKKEPLDQLSEKWTRAIEFMKKPKANIDTLLAMYEISAADQDVLKKVKKDEASTS